MDKFNTYDQYYTSSNAAQDCIEKLVERFNFSDFDIILEPSAGNGAFFTSLPADKRLGFDIDPQHPDIKKLDYFDFHPEFDKRYLVIGNPPFGKNSSLAVQFFNKSAKFASIIAFILPRTFRKKSVINRLDRRFHLIDENILPKDSFIYEAKIYDVPCVFQIWQRQKNERELIKILKSHIDFNFGTKTDAEFAIQRVGMKAGIIRDKITMQNYSWENHFFIKPHSNNVIDIMRNIDFSIVKYNTAGHPCISRSELIELYALAKTNSPDVDIPLNN